MSSLIIGIVGTIRGLALSFAEAKLPHEIVVNYPEGSPAAGAVAGRFMLQRDETGAKFVFANAPAAYKPQPAIAELHIAHAFTDLFSLVRFAEGGSDQGAQERQQVFVDARPSKPANAELILDAARPELGGARLVIPRHPAWQAWAARFGGEASAVPADLTHEQLADLLMDNAEDLVEPALADLVSRFRAAVKIEQDVSLDSEGSSGLRVTLDSGSGSGATKAKLPRTFSARIPAYSGAWEAGGEPAHEAVFRLRVVPPKRGSDAVMPTFRLTWVNAADYELRASRALIARTTEVFTEVATVYAGVPHTEHVLLPEKAT